MPGIARRGLHISTRIVKSIDGMALQLTNSDGVASLLMHHAGTFAEYVDGTRARTAPAQNIRVENAHRRAAQIA